MEQKIKDILNKLGIKINTKGYWFWITAIQYKEKNESANMATLYNEVARMHNTTNTRVERALRHAYGSRKTEIEQYFNIKYSINNSSFLLLMLEELKRERVDIL